MQGLEIKLILPSGCLFTMRKTLQKMQGQKRLPKLCPKMTHYALIRYVLNHVVYEFYTFFFIHYQSN